MPIAIDNENLRFPQITAGTIVGGLSGAPVGWLATHLFTSLNPIAGAIYGVVELLSSALLITPLLNEFFAYSGVEKVAKFVLNFLASAALAATIVTLAGFKITIGASLALSLLMIPTYIITKYVLRELGSLLG